MEYSKNSMSVEDIDTLFINTYCNNCSDSGNCAGCIVMESLGGARKLTKRAPDVSKWNCPQCGFVNFDDERACFACGTKRR